eukprot:m51a1_g13937 hypothetical protein (971) ;mRNA; r:874647-878402
MALEASEIVGIALGCVLGVFFIATAPLVVWFLVRLCLERSRERQALRDLAGYPSGVEVPEYADPPEPAARARDIAGADAADRIVAMPSRLRRSASEDEAFSDLSRSRGEAAEPRPVSASAAEGAGPVTAEDAPRNLRKGFSEGYGARKGRQAKRAPAAAAAAAPEATASRAARRRSSKKGVGRRKASQRSQYAVEEGRELQREFEEAATDTRVDEHGNVVLLQYGEDGRISVTGAYGQLMTLETDPVTGASVVVQLDELGNSVYRAALQESISKAVATALATAGGHKGPRAQQQQRAADPFDFDGASEKENAPNTLSLYVTVASPARKQPRLARSPAASPTPRTPPRPSPRTPLAPRDGASPARAVVRAHAAAETAGDEEAATTTTTTTPSRAGMKRARTEPLRMPTTPLRGARARTVLLDEDDEGGDEAAPARPRGTPGVAARRRASLDSVAAGPHRKKPKKTEKGAQSVAQIEEFGERSRVLDDVEYALGGLADAAAPPSVQRASVVRLAEVCSEGARDVGLVLRAHILFPKLFSLLSTSEDQASAAHTCPQPKLPSPATRLAVAAVILFLLKEDHANAAHMTREGVQILAKEIARLGADGMERRKSKSPEKTLARRNSTGSSSAFLSCLRSPAESPGTLSKKSMEQLQQLFEDFRPCWWDSVNEITAPMVALECMQLLSGAQSSELIRCQCRESGVIDSLKGVLVCSLDMLRKNPQESWGNKELTHCMENCARIMENITLLSKENQECAVQQGFVSLVLSVVSSCQDGLAAGFSPELLSRLLTAFLKVVVNMTEKNEAACALFSEHEGMQSLAPLYDLRVVSLGLLINVCEHSVANREALRKSQMANGNSLVQFVAELFDKSDQEATSAASSQEDPSGSSSQSSTGAVVEQRQNPENELVIKERIAGRSMDRAAAVLGEFIAFQAHAGILSSDARESYLSILRVLQGSQGVVPGDSFACSTLDIPDN